MPKQHSTQTTPVCHTRQIKTGRIIYDYRRKDNSQAKVPWLRILGSYEYWGHTNTGVKSLIYGHPKDHKASQINSEP